ncbi:MAG: DoxX family protein [Chloroflexota bacterium]
MNRLREFYLQTDDKIVLFMRKYGILFLRISLGVVFLWFGFLKFFPGLSPADELATRTISLLTFGIVPPSTALVMLALWETLIGLGLITGKFLRITLLLLFVQMLGTMTPLFLFPSETFTRIPYAPTLEGQYIIKNLVLISAGMVVGATVRGGRIIEERDLMGSV